MCAEPMHKAADPLSGGTLQSFHAPSRSALLAAVKAATDIDPVADELTPYDNVYTVDADRLFFCATFPEVKDEPRERGVVLSRWDATLREGRDDLVPLLGFYYDHDGLLYRCALAYALNAPLALHGHTGVGKTELVRYLAARLGAPLYRANLHGLSTTDDIVGKLIPVGRGEVGFQDGIVTAAVRKGGVLLLEEMNATGQEVWFSLHGLLDGSRALTLVEKDNEVVRQHADCRIYSTFNPAEYPNLYPGTKELSAAYLRRWISVRMGFVSLDTEKAIILRRFPRFAEPELSATLDTMLEVARVCREILLNRVQSFGFVMSTGVLEVWAALTLHVGPVSAAKMTFYDLLDDRMKTLFREQIFAYVTPWDPARFDLPM